MRITIKGGEPVAWILWVIGYLLIAALFFGIIVFVVVKFDDDSSISGDPDDLFTLVGISILWPLILLGIPFILAYAMARLAARKHEDQE